MKYNHVNVIVFHIEYIMILLRTEILKINAYRK
jgi:hypothetical protein